MDADPNQSERPRYAAAVVEDLLAGSRKLRQAFAQAPTRFASRDTPLVRLGDPEPPVILIRTGFAFRSCGLPNGRRAILHIVTPGDFVGLDHLVLARPIEEITAAERVGYNTLPAAHVRELLKDQAINLEVLTLIAQTRWRSDRLAMCIGRFEAPARISVMLLDLYQRLGDHEPISRLSFNLPLNAGADRGSSRPDPGARQPHLAAPARRADRARGSWRRHDSRHRSVARGRAGLAGAGRVLRSGGSFPLNDTSASASI